MNQAMQLEGLNGLKPMRLVESRCNNHLGYFYKVLNHEFVNTFMNVKPDTRKLREFVYAIDAFAEISRTKGFPSGRLLNNIDVYIKPQRAAFMFTNLARMARDPSLYGVAVPRHIEDIIEEMYKREYFKLFGDLFKATSLPYIFCMLDGVQYHITLVRGFRTVPGYSAIRFIDGMNGNEVYIPFLSTRLGNDEE